MGTIRSEEHIPGEVCVAVGQNQYEPLFQWLSENSAALNSAERHTVWKFLRFCGFLVETLSRVKARNSGVSLKVLKGESALGDSMTDPRPGCALEPSSNSALDRGSVMESGADPPNRPSAKEPTLKSEHFQPGLLPGGEVKQNANDPQTS